MKPESALQVKVVSAIEVDDQAAEILNHLTSYQLAADFVRYFSGKYTLCDIQRALNAIHCHTARMLRARRAALEAAGDVATRR